MPSDKDSRSEQLIRATEQLHIVQALLLVADEPHRLLDVVLDAADIDDALDRVRTAFGLTEVQARAVLDAQVRRFSKRDRARMAEMLVDIQAGVEELSQ